MFMMGQENDFQSFKLIKLLIRARCKINIFYIFFVIVNSGLTIANSILTNKKIIK